MTSPSSVTPPSLPPSSSQASRQASRGWLLRQGRTHGLILTTAAVALLALPVWAGSAPAKTGSQPGQALQRHLGGQSYARAVSPPLQGTSHATGPLIRVHRDGDRLLFELRPRILGLGLVAADRTTGATADSAAVGTFLRAFLAPATATAGDFALRYIRDGDSVAVQAWNSTSRTFVTQRHYAIVRFGPDQAPIIDVTKAWVENLGGNLGIEPSVAATLQKKSTLQAIHVFDTHIELDVEHTFTTGKVWVHRSVLALPDVPMRPRIADSRVGYMTVPGVAPDKAPSAASSPASASTSALPPVIMRHRLEKRDPKAAISDVVAPIVFDIDPRWPKQWIPWVKRGIEAWNPTFERAGFRHAIVAREAPKSTKDTTWSLYSLTHSAILWLPADVMDNAGFPVVDPRTGEILSGTIIIRSGIQHLLQLEYAAFAGGSSAPLQVPLPDSVMGKLLSMVVSHEVGHTLGLDHNFLVSTAYPTDSIRNAAFVRRMGHTASVMDYAFVNVVAQPEDHIPIDDLQARIGPYDDFAIAWGYRPIPSATTSEAERPTLEQWRRVQDTAVYLRYEERDNPDFLSGREVVPALDAASRTLGRQINRLALSMAAARRTPLTGQPTERTTVPRDSAALRALLDASWTPADTQGIKEIRQWAWKTWIEAMPRAVAVVGGEEKQGRPKPDSAQQVAAMRFVINHVFRGQDSLVRAWINPDPPTSASDAAFPDTTPFIFRDATPGGLGADFWHQYQVKTLKNLVDHDRLQRVATQSPTVLPVLCTELQALQRDLTTASQRGGLPAYKQHLSTLQAQFEGVTGANGVCHGG